jgi:hypothetical protein
MTELVYRFQLTYDEPCVTIGDVIIFFNAINIKQIRKFGFQLTPIVEGDFSHLFSLRESLM